MGLTLRAAFVWEIDSVDYKNMLHGHSHIAMLGWVFMALYALMVAVFVPKLKQNSAYYRWLFIITQFSVIGMMVAFPIQGYAAVSITFSTLNLLLSYFFAVRIWKDSNTDKTPATYMVRAALLGMFISTIGLWGMAMVMAFKLGNTEWYNLVIQFYLHFQFNVWFILAAIATLLQYLIKKKNAIIFPKVIQRFTLLYFTSVAFTFFHVVHWAYGKNYMYALNSIGVLLQFAAIVYLIWYLFKNNIIKRKFCKREWMVLLQIVLFARVLKGLIQLLLVFPEVNESSTNIRNFMIGYMLLMNLAIVSSLLFYLLKGLIPRFSFGNEMYFFIFGIVATELYLFLQGIFYWQAWGVLPAYYITIFILSIPMLIGVFVIWLRMFINNKALLV